MNWLVILNTFIGSTLALIVVVTAGIVLVVIWDRYDRRKAERAAAEKAVKPPPNEILERHLEEFVVDNFAQLFPGWSIYRDRANSTDSAKPIGVRYRTPAGEIDILCIDEANSLVVIELKRGRAPDTVITQTDRYVDWVQQNIAEPGQRVRGIIIAKRHGEHIIHGAARKDDIDLMTYNLTLTHVPKVLRLSDPS